MKVRSIILLTLDAYGGTIHGKTILQDRLYFMSRLAGEYWDKDIVASELVTLKVQGLVNEIMDRDKDYIYSLTDPAREAIQWLKSRYPEDAQRVQKAAKAVIAAEVYFYG